MRFSENNDQFFDCDTCPGANSLIWIHSPGPVPWFGCTKFLSLLIFIGYLYSCLSALTFIGCADPIEMCVQCPVSRDHGTLVSERHWEYTKPWGNIKKSTEGRGVQRGGRRIDRGSAWYLVWWWAFNQIVIHSIERQLWVQLWDGGHPVKEFHKCCPRTSASLCMPLAERETEQQVDERCTRGRQVVDEG